jgi:hypothetical protein
LPPAVVRTLRPAVQALETAAQRGGRGWWGPSQFVYAQRSNTLPELAAADSMPARMRCPACRGSLAWTSDTADCRGCGNAYQHTDGYWDFTVPSAS